MALKLTFNPLSGQFDYIQDVSGFVPYTGATESLNLGGWNLVASEGSFSILNVDQVNIDGSAVTAVGTCLALNSGDCVELQSNTVVKAEADSEGFHVGAHGTGTSKYVPLYMYDDYGNRVQFKTQKMAGSAGYVINLPDPDQGTEDYYAVLAVTGSNSTYIPFFVEPNIISSDSGFTFKSSTATLTLGTSSTTGKLALVNDTRTTILDAPAATQTVTLPSVPLSTSALNITSAGDIGTVSNTGSGNNVLASTPTITTPAINTYAIITRTSLGSTPNYGLYIRNTTASTSSNRVQFSPEVRFYGSGWGTDGSVNVGLLAKIYLGTVTGTTVTSQLRFDMDQSGGGSETRMRLTNTGNLGVGLNATNPQAQLSVGGNGVANTGFYLGNQGYSYRQAVIADGDGEELFAVFPGYMTDGDHQVSIGDVNDAYNYCRVDVTFDRMKIVNGYLEINDALYGNIILGTTTGTKIGTSTSQKLAFWNATPIVQPATISDPSGGATVDAEARTAINTIIDRLQAIGLIA